MILKKVKLVFVKDHPEKLLPGMICYPKRDGEKPTDYYRLTEALDLSNKFDQHQPVLPYLIDEYDNFESDIDSLFLFDFNNGSDPVPANFDDLIGCEIENVRMIVATPDQIALIEKASHLSYNVDQKKCFDVFDDDRHFFLNKILSSNGDCYVLCKDEFTNPEEYQNVAWGEGKTKVILKNNKVVIYPF